MIVKYKDDLKGDWIYGADKKKRCKYYHMYCGNYPLTALIERKTKIVYLVTDTDKNEIVFNCIKNIDKGDEYNNVF